MPSLVKTEARRRLRLQVGGLVQGVGFRPFVYRVAQELDLSGSVSNTERGVSIEVEGSIGQLDEFSHRLRSEAPALARIDSCETTEWPLTNQTGFKILSSRLKARSSTLISPDIATCDDCLEETFDPKDRRYRYPFINCTNCGPRYTIVDSIPYDRPRTSMKSFPMCPACEQEYCNPSDRRFHAQPNACPDCGPRITLYVNGSIVESPDPIDDVVRFLAEGKIAAVRGIGGFHLAVDATNDEVVRELRRRKGREEKPLALMVPDLNTARKFCHVSPEEEQLPTDWARPIVLLEQKQPCPIAPSVALGNRYFGVMLPYTPLHHLLIRGNFLALVMTSGNFSEEPIVIANEEALERLGSLADVFLLHNREILRRNDDSIVQVAAGARRIVRRARGFVPRPIRLPLPLKRNILACGGELKNSVALTRGRDIFLSQYIGNLDNPAALSIFEETIDYMQRLLEIGPDLIAHDMHPGYLSTRYALNQTELPTVAVQHHHAHLVSVMAENGVTQPTLGIILDGTGYGLDGTIWGGELLLGDARQFERLAWLEPVGMPGGEAAIKQPWRMAISYMRHAMGDSVDLSELPPMKMLPKGDDRMFLHAIDKRINCPLTSSCGRLFDGIASILGICHESKFEAQAAIQLEMAASEAAQRKATTDRRQTYDVRLGPLPVGSIIKNAVAGIRSAKAIQQIAYEFHTDLTDMWVAAAMLAREKTSVNRVALSGGVYQNKLLLELVVNGLKTAQFDILTHHDLPTNDGGLAVGQAVIADNQSIKNT